MTKKNLRKNRRKEAIVKLAKKKNNNQNKKRMKMLKTQTRIQMKNTLTSSKNQRSLTGIEVLTEGNS